MSETKITSASRLLVEIKRLRKAYRTDQQLYVAVQSHFSFGRGHEGSTQGVSRYINLVDKVIGDLACIADERRRNSIRDVVQQVYGLVDPARYHMSATAVYEQSAAQRVVDHLEMLDELFVREGKSTTISEERAATVVAELENVISAVASTSETEIDAFILERLRELQIVLSQYQLHGAEGAEDAVARLIGGILVKVPLIGTLSDTTKENIKKSLQVAKGVVDAFVYTHATGSAIEWVGEKVLAITSAS